VSGPDFEPPPIPPFDVDAADAAEERGTELAKPPGSLGRLEALAVALAGLTADPRPVLDDPVVVVAAADHGVAARGVSAYPSSVTRAMLRTVAAGGAAVNAIADVVGADAVAVDAGVDGPPIGDVDGPPIGDVDGPPFEGVVDGRIGRGTDDIAAGPAMSRADAVAALDAGVRIARTELADADIVALGELGIGNTTVAAALTAALTGVDPDRITGHGTGIDDGTRAHKVEVVERALARNGLDGDDGDRASDDNPASTDPVEVLRRVGGYEVGVLAGVALGRAADRTPVVVDGVVSGAAALLADAIAGDVRPYLLPSHVGDEPGHAVQLDALDLDPLFDHGLRLGEGSGAALALATYRAACRVHDRTATLSDVGIDP
jgi:nicotinate-nucleotide--dimethylbenzimidazole phosphoribosyltransferase